MTIVFAIRTTLFSFSTSYSRRNKILHDFIGRDLHGYCN